MGLNLVNLKQTGTGWEFKTESDLEDFIWANLQQLLKLTPFKRQYCINGQYCDILGLRENKQLVVLELKNNEDRYIVQQLTRYYHALKEEQPLADKVNYQNPIELIAITPSFHRDNFIDRIYSKLNIRFLETSVLLNDNICSFVLKDLDNQHLSKIAIPYEYSNSHEEIAPPPRSLINRISKCEKFSELAKEAILKIRKKILTFDKRMQEHVHGNIIEYGKGKSKKCAEFYFCSPNSPHYNNGRPHLFLKLPNPDPWRTQKTKRMWIWVDESWDEFTGMRYYVKAFISSKNELGSVYKYPNFINRISQEKTQNPLEERVDSCYKSYQEIIEGKTNSLDLLVGIALEHWLKRL